MKYTGQYIHTKNNIFILFHHGLALFIDCLDGKMKGISNRNQWMEFRDKIVPNANKPNFSPSVDFYDGPIPENIRYAVVTPDNQITKIWSKHLEEVLATTLYQMTKDFPVVPCSRKYLLRAVVHPLLPDGYKLTFRMKNNWEKQFTKNN